MIISPSGDESKYIWSLDLQCSNNQAEYQALIIDLRILFSVEAKVIKILGDSQLVFEQLIGEYKCNNPTLMNLLNLARTLLQQFAEVTITHVPWNNNEVANELAQQASGFWLESNEVNAIDLVQI